MSQHQPLQHHFADLDQQYESASLGMWLFLVTEILFFGGIFLAYAIYMVQYPAAFVVGSHHLSIFLGCVNTIVLISSSFTMVMGVHSARIGQKDKTTLYLILTLILGMVFLGIKAIEYTEKFTHHLVPNDQFHFPGFDGPGIRIFYSIYFALTGLHALHMIIGVVILAIIIVFNIKGRYTSEYNSPVDMFGLYWHFVDIVWIFLFPLLYLIGRHG
jgi:cytochrome c oxidase subunit 3